MTILFLIYVLFWFAVGASVGFVAITDGAVMIAVLSGVAAGAMIAQGFG